MNKSTSASTRFGVAALSAGRNCTHSMLEKNQRTKSAHGMAGALARWEDEGGARVAPPASKKETA